MICPTCGLPKVICVCKTFELENTRVIIKGEVRKWGKEVTIIEGLPEHRLKEFAKLLKKGLSCGGSYKDGYVILQGDHKYLVEKILIKNGINKDSIEIR